METNENRKARLGSYHTAQIGLGDIRRKNSKNGLDLIWIEIGFFLNSRNEPARPVMGTIFLVIGREKRAPHWGVQSRFRMIYVSRYGISVLGQKCIGGGSKWPTRMLKVILGRLKLDCDTRVIHFDYELWNAICFSGTTPFLLVQRSVSVAVAGEWWRELVLWMKKSLKCYR